MEYPQTLQSKEELDQLIQSEPKCSSYSDSEGTHVFNLDDGDEALYQQDEEGGAYKKQDEYQLSGHQIGQRKRYAPQGTGKSKQGRKLKQGRGKCAQVKSTGESMDVTRDSLRQQLREGNDLSPEDAVPNLSYNSPEACERRLERFQISESVSMFDLSSTIRVLGKHFEDDQLLERAQSMERAEQNKNIERAHRLVESVLDRVDNLFEQQAQMEFLDDVKQTFEGLLDRGHNADQIIDEMAQKYEAPETDVAEMLIELDLIEEREEGDHGSHGDHGDHGSRQEVAEEEDEEPDEDEEDEEDEEAEETNQPEFGESQVSVSGSEQGKESIRDGINSMRGTDEETDSTNESDTAEDDVNDTPVPEQGIEEKLQGEFPEKDDETIQQAVEKAQTLSENVGRSTESLARTYLS